MTIQRSVILDELRRDHGHPTVDEVYRRVRRRLPRISLGTVYRNLELLAESGQARMLKYGPGRMRFDGTISNHDHVRCVRCGRLDDVPGEAVSAPRAVVEVDTGYVLSGYSLLLCGVCPLCQKTGGLTADPRDSTSGAKPRRKRQ